MTEEVAVGQKDDMEVLGAEGASSESQEAAQPGASDKLPAPQHGFDESGDFFIVKVHVRYGYIFILGFLQKAADWLKFYVGNQQREIEKRKLVKPNNKAFGRFNLFRGK